MKISKKQIKQLDKGEVTVRELFPDVFRTNLEVGKWYKYDDGSNYLLNYQGCENEAYISAYGFNPSEYVGLRKNNYCSIGLIPATEQEVFEALKKEAIKRGVWNTKNIDNSNIGGTVHSMGSFSELFDNNVLWSIYGRVFTDGVWAKPTQTITKEEAEKQLGKKIV